LWKVVTHPLAFQEEAQAILRAFGIWAVAGLYVGVR
jgi:hypothetical protein